MISIVDYDPSWPVRAEALISAITEALPGVFSAIEHIGSTAVPGLAAKPVIDLMAAAGDFEAVRAGTESLAALGFQPHDNGMRDRLLFHVVEDGVPTVHLHVVSTESWPTRNQRILRDHLREHPEDAARYAELKRGIVAAGTHPRDYAAAKTDLIQELTDRARAARGLPSVPVWEK